MNAEVNVARTAQMLANLRTMNDMSQAQVAAEIGVSQSAVASYETGRRVPRDEVKVAYSRLFGVPVGKIFYGEVHKCSSK